MKNFIESLNILGVDGGEKGGLFLSSINMTVPMPVTRYEKSPSIYEIQKEKVKGKSKKQPILIKSGKNKGKPKLKKVIDSTKDYYIDIKTLVDYNLKNADLVVLEKIGQTFGQSALKQANNIEAIRIATRLLDIHLIEVSATRWKEHFSLDDDKEKCVAFANARSGLDFQYAKGNYQDGEAESYLIYLWFVEFYLSLEIGKKYKYTAKKIGKKYKQITVKLLELNGFMATVETNTGYIFNARVEELREIKDKGVK